MNFEMTENMERQLTRLYVALVMTRNVVERDVEAETATDNSRSAITLVNVASQILEEILNPEMGHPATTVSDVSEMEMVM